MTTTSALEERVPRSRAVRWSALAILVAILAPLIVVRVRVGPGVGPWGLDASNYYQMARNVAEGRGLVTSVSLYFFGLDPLPQSTSTIYPLWPLVLGFVGRYIGMLEAVRILPRALYVLDLFLLYWLSNLVARRWWKTEYLLGERIPVNLGHLMVALFGTTGMFFSATTHPYTEGLAFAFAFASLGLLDEVATSKRWFWPALAGLAAGLAFLTRTQMVMVGIGILFAFGAVVWRRREKILALALFLVPFAACFGWWYFAIFRVAQSRAPIKLFAMWSKPPTLGGYLAERLLGFAVGFAAASPMSYVNLFGLATYLFPIAALVFLFRFLRDRESRMEIETVDLAPLATLIAGLGFFFSLDLFHEQYFLPWLFGWRHGLPYLLLIVCGTGYLLAHSRSWVRYAIVAVVVASVVMGSIKVVDFAAQPEPAGLTPAETHALAWIDDHHSGTPTILTTHAQTLAVFSRANFHWTICDANPEETKKMLELLPIDFVLVYGGENRCPFAARSVLFDALQVAAVAGTGDDRIYVLRPTAKILSQRARLRHRSR